MRDNPYVDQTTGLNNIDNILEDARRGRQDEEDDE